MAIRPETIAGRKEYFRKKRETENAAWATDGEGIVHIPLGHECEALIDASDREWVSQLNWHLRKGKKKNGKTPKPYAEAKIIEELRSEFGEGEISLHRFIMRAPRGIQIDHADGDGLNCRRGNMRFASSSQNASNRRYKNRTGYRGVYVSGSRYGAQLEVNGKNRHLGVRATPEEAALLYNEHALAAFGEFAILNEVSCA